MDTKTLYNFYVYAYLSETKIGKHPSEETKRKISETLLRRNRLCENIIQPSGMEDFI